MKKLLSLLLIPAFLLSFAACSDSGEETEEEETVSYSSQETAKEYLLATFEGNVGKQYDFDLLNNEVREKAFLDHAKSVGLTTKEYYERLSAPFNANVTDEDDIVILENYDEYIAMTNIATYTSKQETYEETFGKEYSITVNVYGESEITGSDLDNYRSQITREISYFEDEYSTDVKFDGSNVTKMVRMNYTVTIDGNKDDDTFGDGEEIILAEIDGVWKVCRCDAQNY